MSSLSKHIYLLEESYQLLTDKLGREYFPSYRQLRRYEGLLGPDIFHSVKFFTGIWGYKKFNHMNTKIFSGAIQFSETYYQRLVKKLRMNSSGGKEAAWLAHFIADSIEPAHLSGWRNGKNQRKKLKKHLWLEKITRGVKNNQKIEITKISKPVRNYLLDVSKKIKTLRLSTYSKPNKLLLIYKNKIVPPTNSGHCKYLA